jgi:hypothetical protein
MKSIALVAATFLGAAGLAAFGCAVADDGANGDESHLEGAGDACKIFDVPSQKFIDLKTFAEDPKHPERKNDPVLKRILAPVLQGKACPTNYTEIQRSPGLQSCKLETRIISERSMYLQTPDLGRALASRTCSDESGGIFFLIDPIHAGKDLIPTDVELLGEDSVDGIFSYYAREAASGPRDSFSTDASEVARMKEPAIWKFYGTSADFVSNGYDCATAKFHGACQSRWAQDKGVPGNASGARCASCHPGGGMVQKELDSPWTYWQQDPGADSNTGKGGYTTKRTDVYGQFQSGADFEGVTKEKNTKWAKKRVQLLAKKSIKDVLRPVFCTLDVNLQAGLGDEGDVRIRSDLLVDPVFHASINAAVDPDNYKAAITELKQTIRGFPTGKFTDTPDPFIYPERSALDSAYVDALIADEAKLKLGEDLIRDILFVDFTRPIYSPTRCGLVDLADGITNGATAKADFVKKLTAMAPKDGTPESEFLRSLASTEAAPRHEATVSNYIAACTARAEKDNAGLTRDAVRYASHLRQVTQLMKVKLKVERDELGILDFDETVPFTSLSDGPVVDERFDPATCVLGK